MRNLYSVLSLLLITSLITLGQVPQTTSFQGVLTDSEGAVVEDGDHSLNFKLYDSATNGTVLWEETQIVSTVGGVFNVILGIATILDLPFDEPYWIEMSIDGGEALSPRVELTSSFYSLMTKSIEDSTISTAKLQDNAVTTEKLSDGSVTQAKLSGSVSLPPGGEAGGDLIGSYPNPTIAENAVNSAKVADNSITVEDINPNVVSSINEVSNDGGNVDLVEGSNITITPNDGTNTITISAATGASDNLGNHTATENIKLNGNYLSGDGGNEGVFITNDGNVGIATDNPSSLYKLHVMQRTDQQGKTAIFGHATVSTPINYSGYGVYGLRDSEGTGGSGVFGQAVGAGHGVYGLTDDTDSYGIFGENTNNGYAGYFLGKGYFRDYLGIGTQNPNSSLHIQGNPSSRIQFDDSGAWDWIIGSTTISNEAFTIYAATHTNSSFLRFRIATNGDTHLSPLGGNVGIGTMSPGYLLEVNGSAGKPGGGSWTNSSDIRLKNIHGNYKKGLEEIIQLRPVSFRYKENNTRNLPADTDEIGFIAQDVQKVFPEAVNEGSDGYFDFNMHSINVAVVNAIRELKTENDILKEKINRLERLLAEVIKNETSIRIVKTDK